MSLWWLVFVFGVPIVIVAFGILIGKLLKSRRPKGRLLVDEPGRTAEQQAIDLLKKRYIIFLLSTDEEPYVIVKADGYATPFGSFQTPEEAIETVKSKIVVKSYHVSVLSG